MITYLLSLLVIPHGITDIILSYETNTVLQMLSIYSLIPPLVMFITNPLYNILFIGSSIIHFSHDSYSIIPLLLILDYSVNPTHFIDVFNYMIYYLSFIHVPIHYIHIFLETSYFYKHVFIIGCMTIISGLISPYIIDWIHIHSGDDKLSKFIGGIILSHILFNEYLNLLL